MTVLGSWRFDWSSLWGGYKHDSTLRGYCSSDFLTLLLIGFVSWITEVLAPVGIEHSFPQDIEDPTPAYDHIIWCIYGSKYHVIIGFLSLNLIIY